MKNYIGILLLILCISSCDRVQKKVQLRNELFEYKNYLETKILPFATDSFNALANLDTIDLGKTMHFAHKKKIEGVPFHFLLKEIEKAHIEFDRNQNGADYSADKSDSTFQNVQLFFLGRLNYKQNSLLFLKSKRVRSISGNSMNHYIVLVNLKANQLRSIGLLTYKFEGELFGREIIPPKTYFVNKSYFIYKDEFIASNCFASEPKSWYEVRNFKELKEVFGLSKRDNDYINYSAFCVDSIGFIRFGILTDNEIAKYIQN